MLTKEIAQQIVQETMQRLNKNINIIDQHGRILASGDAKRVDQIHEGALEVIKSNHALIIDHPSMWKGALPGVNLPIVFDEKLVGVIGITGDPLEIQPIAELVKMTTEMMIRQAFIATQLEWRQQIKELIFTELIQPNPNLDALDQRLRLLKLKLDAPYQVALIEISEKSIPNSSLLKTIRENTNLKQMVCGFLHVHCLFILSHGLSEEKVLLKLNSLKRILKQMRMDFQMGLGSEVSELRHTYISFQEAQLAIELGEKEQSLISYADIEIKFLLSQIGAKYRKKFSERTLASLSSKDLSTLEKLFACHLNLSETAKQLYIHRNTLMYRLTRIKERTGYNPQHFHDAATLQMALWMRKEHAGEDGMD
ncbi:hypothetical protein BEP19_11365 [Ammoniphilus oxalaticus]|uniref:Transcriptional regulator n=1 Tax=Ammoniphilus oxalaticus TaxID=66863 RepID=A0A419SGB8_9BACL|nr:sugar diacid recognition domain-containing protein [Ammoniphilus oxalaticus]RKD22834.1 hypothetical protein BEP19_11365 [Ammoniphilus oxalaticus]